MHAALPTVFLKKNEDRRILSGHLWIYSNEIDNQKSPLRDFTAGQLVKVASFSGKLIGIAYINPNNLLCVRLLTRNSDDTINTDFFIQRLHCAMELRQRVFQQPYYRLVYGESDELPGLIVDRYNDILVVQITTAGMEGLKSFIIEALITVINPRGILLRNDNSMRVLEGLTQEVVAAFGEVPPTVELIENNARYKTSVWEGQKTGWFYDHRDNRARLQKYVTDKRVLDVFSYIGAWSIPAALYGAHSVVCVDASLHALNALQKNAELNNVADKIHLSHNDAFAQLKTLREEGETFDVIIVDPPAFIKRRKDSKEGLIAYQRINELAMRLLVPGGILVSSSCSLHLSKEMLIETLSRSSTKLQRFLQIIEQGHQGLDHPIHPSIPETDYLKAIFCVIN
jgi:23S rRNA (cytosine1962-C5)-methyltransferase